MIYLLTFYGAAFLYLIRHLVLILFHIIKMKPGTEGFKFHDEKAMFHLMRFAYVYAVVFGVTFVGYIIVHLL